MIMTALKINYSNCAIGDFSIGKFLCKMQMKRLRILSYFTHEKITKENSIDFVYLVYSFHYIDIYGFHIFNLAAVQIQSKCSSIMN